MISEFALKALVANQSLKRQTKEVERSELQRLTLGALTLQRCQCR